MDCSVATEDVAMQDLEDQEEDTEDVRAVGSDVIRNCHVLSPLIFAFGRAASR